LTPLFPVDYTRSIARETHAHQSVVIQVATAGLILRTVENGKGTRRKDTRGRLGHDEPLESVGRVNLQERIVRWTSQAIVWLIRKVVAMLLLNATPVPTFRRAPTGEGSAPRRPGVAFDASATGSPRNFGSRIQPHPDIVRPAIALHRDPWCGTHVSPEISFPLQQAGQVMHFCSAECRTRYQQSSQRAASA